MRRRRFIAGLAATTSMPHVSRGQRAFPVIGFLSTAYADRSVPLLQAFRKGLAEAGFEEGRNVAIEYRWAEGRNERLPELARDLVARNVAVIAATGGSPASLAAKAVSSTIPIVFQVGVDPVPIGLVESLNRPGGNVTGATMITDVLEQKRMELLREVMPRIGRMAVLINPTAALRETLDVRITEAARVLGLELAWIQVATEREVDAAFEKLSHSKPEALVIASSSLFSALSAKLGALSLNHRLPAIYQSRPFVAGGGLMSYGGSIADAFRIAGVYTGRVLNGDKPADLPVQQSTVIELMLNLKTAKALGIEVPFMMIARAHEVIE